MSSAAQSPVDPQALSGQIKLSDDFEAFAQSKLALTMWSRSMALSLKNTGPTIIEINPGSMLGNKMVKEGFGVADREIHIGADVLIRAALEGKLAALEGKLAAASGRYFDNDSGRFASPHPDALDPQKSEEIVHVIEIVLCDWRQTAHR